MNGLAEPGEPDRDGSGPDLRLLFARAMVRSLGWALLLTLLGAAVGIGVGLWQPNRYVSNAKLSLRMGAREQLNAESLVDVDGRQRMPPTMIDELQMLSDVAILERVARSLGPRSITEVADPARDDGPSTPVYARLVHLLQRAIFRSSAEPSAESDERELRLATRALQENTIVTSEPGSSVILVVHTSTSAEKARAILQALSSAFIQRHREQYSLQALLEKGRSQLEEARVSRDETAKAYVERVSQGGTFDLEAQVPRLEIELSALESELFESRVRREEIGRLRTALSNRLEGIPAEILIQRPSVMIPNEEYETQLALKRQALAQKQEMLIQNRPSEEMRRREKEFDNQIAKIDQKLKATPKAVAQDSEMQANLSHSAMEARIVELEVEDESLPVKIGLLEARLVSRKARLSEMQKQLLAATMEQSDLMAARDAEEKRYAHQLERLSVLEALEDIDANEDANLSVLQAASLEPEKVGPRRGSLLLKGLLAGMMAGIAFAVLRQRFESRLCDPETFEQARGVPVLGIVPHHSSLWRLEERALIAGR